MRANEFIIEISKKYDNMIPPPHWDPRWPVEYRKIYEELFECMQNYLNKETL